LSRYRPRLLERPAGVRGPLPVEDVDDLDPDAPVIGREVSGWGGVM